MAKTGWPPKRSVWIARNQTMVEVVGHDTTSVHVKYLCGPTKTPWAPVERFYAWAFRGLFRQVPAEAIS